MSYQNWNQTLIESTATGSAISAQSATDLRPDCDFTFPTNYFWIGSHLRITALGIASTTTGSNTMTFSVQMGATTISQALGAITLVASQTNQKFKLVLDIECRAIGSGTATTFMVQGIFNCSTALLAVTTQLLPSSGAGALGTGVDATATQKLQLMGAWSAASNSITVEQYELTSLN